jgi:hypothetical protein
MTCLLPRGKEDVESCKGPMKPMQLHAVLRKMGKVELQCTGQRHGTEMAARMIRGGDGRLAVECVVAVESRATSQ